MRTAVLAAIATITVVAGGIVASTSASAAVTRTTAHLNMRFGPGVDYRRITTIPPGQIVNVHGCPSNWCVVSWRRHKGYVSGRYLSTHKTTVVSPIDKFGQ